MFVNLQNVLDKKIYHVYTVKLWVKEKWPYKTGDLLKEVQFIWISMTGQEKGDLLIQVTA